MHLEMVWRNDLIRIFCLAPEWLLSGLFTLLAAVTEPFNLWYATFNDTQLCRYWVDSLQFECRTSALHWFAKSIIKVIWHKTAVNSMKTIILTAVLCQITLKWISMFTYLCWWFAITIMMVNSVVQLYNHIMSSWL